MNDRIRESIESQRLAPVYDPPHGGDSIQVLSREQAWVSPYSRVVVETAPGRIEVLSPDQTTGVEVESVTFTEIQNQTG